MWLWLRRLVRRTTRPIPLSAAERWNRRLSLAYSLLAWNAGGFVLYMVCTGRSSWNKKRGEGEEPPLPPSQYFANLLGINKAHVIHVSGFTKVKEFDISPEDALAPDASPDASPDAPPAAPDSALT